MPRNGARDCAVLYGHALTNPEAVPQGICQPGSSFPLPSWKVKVRQQVSWSTGTAGLGYLLLNPYIGFDNTEPCIAATTNFYSGTSGSAMTTVGSSAVTTASMPGPNGDGTSNVVARVVAAGFRTSPTTPGMNRGGLLVSVVNPNHNTYAGTHPGNVVGELSASRLAFGTERDSIMTLFGGPIKDADIEFNQKSAMPNAYCMCVIATSSETQSFITDITIHYELRIQDNSAALTPSESDIQGAGIASAAVNNRLMNNVGRTAWNDRAIRALWNTVDAALKVGSQVITRPEVVSMIQSTIASALARQAATARIAPRR